MADPNSTKSNPIITSWGYDAFGRKTSEVRPDNTSTTWTWGPCTSNCGSSVYQIAQAIFPTSGGAIRTDTNLYDRIDRITQTSGPTVTGATAYVQTKYWPLGMLYQQSMPYLSGNTEYWQTYNYDVLNRLSSVTRPISSSNSNPQTTSYAYAGRTTVVSDPYGNKTTTITDVKGQLRQTKDAVGYTITRAYDTAESLTGITDSLTNALLTSVTYNYGIRPFLVAGIDADRGAFTNTFDSLGERTSWTDDEGDRFYMTFDALSRLCSFSDFWTKC